MIPSAFIPLMVALGLAVAVTTVHRRLPPTLAARSILVTLVVVSGAALPALWIVSLGFLSDAPFVGAGFTWCTEALGGHHHLPVWVGVSATLIALGGALRVLHVLRVHRRLRHDRPGFVEIAGHEQPFAFTLPGRGGHIVLSSGLVGLLDDAERDIVLAHEQAHARHRHDRYLLIAKVTSAAIPFLRPVSSRLQFSLERWADEAAAAQCGDRRFVARTLAKVAMSRGPVTAGMGFARLGVPARVAALLAPPTTSPPRTALFGLWAAIGMTAALAAFQIHHLAVLITALCPG